MILTFSSTSDDPLPLPIRTDFQAISRYLYHCARLAQVFARGQMCGLSVHGMDDVLSTSATSGWMTVKCKAPFALQTWLSCLYNTAADLGSANYCRASPMNRCCAYANRQRRSIISNDTVLLECADIRNP